MKANNGSGNNELRDSWETPKWLFDILNKQYKFTFDCCATKENTKCRFFSDNLMTIGFSTKEILWMNPPFSKAFQMFNLFFDSNCCGVAIYRCDNFETKIWQEKIFPYADWIFIPNKRIAYEGMNGSGSRFPSALIGIGLEPPKGIKGVCLKL